MLIFATGLFSNIPPYKKSASIKEKKFFSSFFPVDQKFEYSGEILRNISINTSNGILIISCEKPESGTFTIAILDENKKEVRHETIDCKGKDFTKILDLSDFPCNAYTIYITQNNKAFIHTLII